VTRFRLGYFRLAFCDEPQLTTFRFRLRPPEVSTFIFRQTHALSQFLKHPLHTLFHVSTSGALVRGVYQRAVSVKVSKQMANSGWGPLTTSRSNRVWPSAFVLKVNASVRKLFSTIEAHLVSPVRDREWTAYVAMPAPKEPLEHGLYSKFHSLLPWQFALHFRAPSCMRTLAFWVKENSSVVGKVLRNNRFTDCWAQSPLATLFRPRGAERVQYEGIAYSQRGGIHHNLVGIKSVCVECHAPGLVVNGTAAVLTRGLSTVAVAMKPHGWSSVRHKCCLTLISLSQRRVA
jgi:hypothetical protein